MRLCIKVNKCEDVSLSSKDVRDGRPSIPQYMRYLDFRIRLMEKAGTLDELFDSPFYKVSPPSTTRRQFHWRNA